MKAKIHSINIRKGLTATLLLSLLLQFLPPIANAQESSDFKEQEVIVVYENKDGKNAALENSNEVDHQFKNIPAVAVTVDAKDLKKLLKDEDIKRIEPNISFKATGYTQQEFQWNWGVEKTKPLEAWNSNITGKGVKVAVLDSGIAPHTDLFVAGGVSTVDYTSSYIDDNGHGTHVAGVIGAKANGFGMVGVAPESSIYSVKVLGSSGYGNLVDILEGLDWAIQNKMDIVNMSLGTSADSPSFREMVTKATNSGVTLIAAAGNSGNATGTGDSVGYPAKYPNVISVSAYDINGNRASFSSTGEKVDVAAPGVNIISTYLNGQYVGMNGTSMASPHVAGLVALLKQQNPSLTSTSVLEELKKRAVDLGAAGKDTWFGYGAVQYPSLNLLAPLDPAVKTQLDKATGYVVKAERTKTHSTVNFAQNELNKLPEMAEKQTLQTRLNVVKEFLVQKEILAKVTVIERNLINAENTKQIRYVHVTRNLLEKLPECAQKEGLQIRLDTIAKIIDNEMFQAQVKTTEIAVARAELYLTKSNYDKALRAVTGLRESSEKSAFQVRLDGVVKAIDAKLFQEQVRKVESSVAKAERYLTRSYYDLAVKAVTGLKDSTEKTVFQGRLDGVIKAINEKALKAQIKGI